MAGHAVDRKVYRDYEIADVEKLYRDAVPRSWREVLEWLTSSDWSSTLSAAVEPIHFVADVTQILQDNVPFTSDPERAYHVLRSHRNPAAVKRLEVDAGRRARLASSTSPVPRSS